MRLWRINSVCGATTNTNESALVHKRRARGSCIMKSEADQQLLVLLPSQALLLLLGSQRNRWPPHRGHTPPTRSQPSTTLLQSTRTRTTHLGSLHRHNTAHARPGDHVPYYHPTELERNIGYPNDTRRPLPEPGFPWPLARAAPRIAIHAPKPASDRREAGSSSRVRARHAVS